MINVRYIIDILPSISEDLNRIVTSGKYQTVQDFIRVAIENQVYLESQEIQGLDSAPSTTAGNTVVTLTSQRKKSSDFLHLRPGMSRARTVPISNCERPSYIWGQYNKFLPVKVVTRVAANLLVEHGTELLPLSELQETAADAARELGKMLQRSDVAMGRKRGAILSAALPVGREQEKAKRRFETQFVGYIVKNRMEGAAPTLKFVEVRRDTNGSTSIGLTDFGLKFATISNPVLDGTTFETPLSEEEGEFLLRHISNELPEEAKMMQYILTKIREGVDTPEALNKGLGTDFLNDGWQDNEIIAMRSGLVSRLSELGLLTRQKEGVNVTYALTTRGEEYLTSALTREVP